MPATKTDLLDRYLHAVKFWLPKAQQQDILAELGEDLHSQIEEREAALGHPLDEADIAAILKQRGAPMRVASGYLPELRLINPAMMPAYRLVLKIVLLWVLGPLFILIYIGPAVSSSHPERILLQFWAQAWQTGFMVVGIVTLVFALLDRYQSKIKGLDQWDPRKLPRIPVPQETSARWNCLAGFVFGTLAAILWVGFMWQRTEFVFPGEIRVILGPIWNYLYWPIFGLTLFNASVDLLAFLYPCWMQTRLRIRIGVDACTILAAALLFKIDDWLNIAAPNLTHADKAKALSWINSGIQIGLIAIVVVSLIDVIQQVRLLRRRKSAPRFEWGMLF